MRIRSVEFVGWRWGATGLLSVLIHAPAIAQKWTLLATTGPPALVNHAMSHDSLRGRTVLFGGSSWTGSSTIIHGDTWEWSGSTWAQRSNSGPQPRNHHAIAYDSMRGKTVLFGGSDGNSSSFLGDTWEWDGSAWTQVSTSGPMPRRFHAMVFDSQRGRTMVFGGGGVVTWPSDTWDWDGSTWTQVSTTGPIPRTHHAMAYDSHLGKTVMFGGSNFGTHYAETWEWNGATWTLVATTGPAGRSGHAMAYDSQRGRTVLFGGHFNTGGLDDVWEWNGVQWLQIATWNGPVARYSHAMAYDSQRRETVMFGDLYGPSETWAWRDAPGNASTFGAGCGNPAMVLSPTANARPVTGTTARASLANVPTTLAFVALGWSNTLVGPFGLPFTLVGYGMPGCFLLQSMDASSPAAPTGPGAATYSLALPNWSGLIGLHLYLQGWANAPGANTANVIVSNGVEWVIGNT